MNNSEHTYGISDLYIKAKYSKTEVEKEICALRQWYIWSDKC